MQVYVFSSAGDSTVRAFSSDPMGRNLPSEYAPWRRDTANNMITIDLTTDPMADDIREQGYHLVRFW